MLRSFSYAAYAGLFAHSSTRPGQFAELEPWARLWQTWASAAFLTGYFDDRRARAVRAGGASSARRAAPALHAGQGALRAQLRAEQQAGLGADPARGYSRTSSAASSGSQGHAAGLDGLVSPDSPTWRAGAALQITADTARGTRFGALPEGDGVRFRVPAPPSRQLQLRLLTGAAAGTYPLDPQSGDTQSCFVPGASRRRSLRLFDRRLRPAPRSRVALSAGRRSRTFGNRRSSRLPLAASAVDRTPATRAHALRAARRHLHSRKARSRPRGSGSASCTISASRRSS